MNWVRSTTVTGRPAVLTDYVWSLNSMRVHWALNRSEGAAWHIEKDGVLIGTAPTLNRALYRARTLM